MRRWWLIGIGVILLAVAGGFVYVTSIDWNEHKNRIATEISQKTGKNVVIEGELSLSLLPSPNLMVQNIKVFSQDKQISEPLFSVKRLVAQLELIPFLKGEFKVNRMSLANPLLRLEVLEDGSFNWKSNLTASQRQELEEMPVTLESVTVDNAEIDYINKQKDVDWKFTNLNAEVMAQTLFGPFQINGSYMREGMPEGFSIGLGKISDDFDTTLSFVFNHPQLGTIYRFDGTVLFKNEALNGNLIFDSKKIATFLNAYSKDFKLGEKYDQPLTLSSVIKLTKDKLELSELAMKYGKTTAAGNVIIPRLQEVKNWNDKDKLQRQKIEAAFNLTELDLGLVLDFIKENSEKYFKGGKFEPNYPWDIVADAQAVKANYNNQVIKNMVLSVDVKQEKIEVSKMNMILPGETTLEAKGNIFPDKKKILSYAFDAQSATENLDVTLDWLKLKPEIRQASTYKKFSGKAKIMGNVTQVKISPLEILFDGSQIKGSLGWDKSGEKTKIFAILDADNINFDNYLPPMPADVAEAGLDKKLKFVLEKLAGYNAYELHFMNKLGLGIYGALPFENVQMSGNYANSVLNMNKLSIGSVLNSKVALDGRVARLENGEINFEKLNYAVETQDLKSPLNKLGLTIPHLDTNLMKKFNAKGDMSGGLQDFSLNSIFKLENMDGSFSGKVSQNAEVKNWNGKLRLKNPDFVKMLNDWGVAYKPNVYSLGIFSFDGEIDGNQNKMNFKNATLTVGQDVFAGDLSYDNTQGRPKLDGQLKISQLEFERYFYGSNAKNVADKVSFVKSGKAAFLNRPQVDNTKIDYAFYNSFDLNLGLEIEKFLYQKAPFSALKGKVAFDLGNLTFSDVQAKFKEAEIQGSLKMATSAVPTFSADFDVKNLAMENTDTVGQKYGFEDGLLRAKIIVDGSAESTAAMLAGLNGEASFEIANTHFRGWNFVAIIDDLKKRKVSDGLAVLVKKNLESGVAKIDKFSGALYFKKGSFELKDAKMSAPDLSIVARSNGVLQDWEATSVFGVKIPSLKQFPGFSFTLSGSLENPLLDVDIKPITDVLDAEKNRLAEEQRAKEQAVMDALKGQMQKIQDTLKIFDGNLYKIKRDYDNYQKMAQKPEIVEAYKGMQPELELIQKNMSEISTLAMTPKYDETLIAQADEKLRAVIERLGDFRIKLMQHNQDDLKYQIGVVYDEAILLEKQAQESMQIVREKNADWKKRIDKVKTGYDLSKDDNVTNLSKSLETRLLEIVEEKEALVQGYLTAKNLAGDNELQQNLQKSREQLAKIKQNVETLNRDVAEYMQYTEAKISTEEEQFNQAQREAEIKRKVAENIGKISVKGDAQSRTVVRDIEEIEKSEKLQEKEKIKVLDFSTKKKQDNTVVRQGKKETAKEQKQEGSFLKKSSGVVSKASGVITRK